MIEIKVGDYGLDIIPFDNDVLSMEMDGGYRECFLDGDKTSLLYIARAIMRLQQLYGVIPHIKGKGSCARIVTDMLYRMRRERDTEEPKSPEIDTLILIDRQVDMVTPMCTQLTYEGLIDETFNIHTGYVDLDPEMIGPPPPAPGQPTPKGRKRQRLQFPSLVLFLARFPSFLSLCFSSRAYISFSSS
jgi:hypothetical protein